MLTARDIMTENVVSIRPTCSIRSAIERLMEEQISGLPVVDENEQLVGIITEFALLATAYDSNVTKDCVARHMTTDVLTVNADDPIRRIADLFIVHRVRRVPVLDKGRIVGLIARRDVLKAVYETQPAAGVV
jgi:CBS domain-containing protein